MIWSIGHIEGRLWPIWEALAPSLCRNPNSTGMRLQPVEDETGSTGAATPVDSGGSNEMTSHGCSWTISRDLGKK